MKHLQFPKAVNQVITEVRGFPSHNRLETISMVGDLRRELEKRVDICGTIIEQLDLCHGTERWPDGVEEKIRRILAGEEAKC